MKLWTSEFHQLSSSNEWKRPTFKVVKWCTSSIELLQYMNTTTQKTLSPNLDHSHWSSLTTCFSLTLNTERDPYWDEDLYDWDKLDYKETYHKPNDEIESNDLIPDSHVSDALWYALIDSWTINPQLVDTFPLSNFQPRPQNHRRQLLQSLTTKFCHSSR